MLSFTNNIVRRRRNLLIISIRHTRSPLMIHNRHRTRKITGSTIMSQSSTIRRIKIISRRHLNNLRNPARIVNKDHIRPRIFRSKILRMRPINRTTILPNMTSHMSHHRITALLRSRNSASRPNTRILKLRNSTTTISQTINLHSNSPHSLPNLQYIRSPFRINLLNVLR